MKKIEFGDFQTPVSLANDVVDFVKQISTSPSVVLEPTCGSGSFLKAGINHFGNTPKYYGFDVNNQYVDELRQSLELNKTIDISLEETDFFEKDWGSFFRAENGDILVIGNPPWITNSTLGSLGSENLPNKSNFQKLSGLAAKTGKANFDIAEWMLITLIESINSHKACLAMLCKTVTARKVLKYLWLCNSNINNSSIHLIDAKKHFNASVDACLFLTHIEQGKKEQIAYIYSDLSFQQKISCFGIYENELVANIDDYHELRELDGIGYYKWRSGIKHDASKVMEFSFKDGKFINGFGHDVEIEPDYVYPLLKSSDLANKRLNPKKFVLITQKHMSDSTDMIQDTAPKTWRYLESHSSVLDNRKSIIYKKRSRFSIFGIGDYSFSKWKVAISGLYKNINFSVVSNIEGKPIMVDDTCYFISCDSQEEAEFICKLLNSDISQKFLYSLIFLDAKRPVNIDILKRVDLKKIAERYHLQKKAVQYFSERQISFTGPSLCI